MRPRPDVPSWARKYWQEAAAGVLVVQYCDPCERYLHPPVPECPVGHGEPHWRRVSGRGTVWASTVQRRDWLLDFDRTAPFVFLLVELDEQRGLLMPSDADVGLLDRLLIGDRVRVEFVTSDGISLPQFRPDSAEVST